MFDNVRWDKVLAVLVVLLVIGVIGAGVVGFVYAIATGAIGSDVSVSGDIVINGTISLNTILIGAFALLAIIIYTSMTEVWGEDQVENASEEVSSLTQNDD